MDRAQQREAFIRGQHEALHKAITKFEVPLKPKHARTIVVGTHREKSSNIFWNTVSRIQLEKHPVLAWKFCHIVHKILRDGYRKCPEEAFRYESRFTNLALFWKHLNTSGYGPCIEAYCKLLQERIIFHNRYPVVPGKLDLTENQLRTLECVLDNMFEMTIDMLDQMDNLLDLQQKVYDMLLSLRWSSLIPQGQCMLAPLIIVILDSSKFYDYLVKMIFKLHASVPADALEGHRQRFIEVFRRTKKFYEESSNLQYFKYLVSIPTLPSSAPNFMQQSDLESYRTPHAYLRSEESEDGTSFQEETLLNFDNDDASFQQASPTSQTDAREEQIIALQRSLEDERFAKERLIQEARSRIEQYENRLVQMQNECDHARQEVDEHREERDRLRNELMERDVSRIQSDDARVKEAEAKAKASEDRFGKMKAVYEKFRLEHVQALTKLGELQKQLEASDKLKMDKEEELTALHRKVEEAEREAARATAQADGDASVVEDLRSQLAKADMQLEELRRTMENEKAKHETALVQSGEKYDDEKQQIERQFDQSLRNGVLAMFERCDEELPNATSISYPPHLAQSAMATVLSLLADLPSKGPNQTVYAGHVLASTLVASAAAAYTASIQHYEGVNDQCKLVLASAKKAIATSDGDFDTLRHNASKLNDLLVALPLQTDIDKDVVGSELEQEMKRMDEVIRRAVEEIEAIQKKARENTTGQRLEVNESILGCCQALMSAIMQLVIASRELQAEIVAAGKAGGSPAEFYKRNHQWTEGLLSAAKAVGVAAKVLVTSADGVVTGQGKFEHLIVAAQEIAACTAQLFVSSRVKADRESAKLATLSVSSKAVNQCTAQVVAAVQSGKTTLNDHGSLDFSNLTLHEAKKEEMESQVRMLELEQELNKERARLSALRKKHYHMAQLVADKDNAGENSFEMIG
ncbi:unnamed protein product [Caenorhabditis auriculariae]|uniref:I/LWEQ domain-containing protein n=1 Tax=Caenorhabditis auriculariae TaxID=2777116 RepID=A0A8S1HSY1_9PELO|nr:unnamed protein product [Caenorhabditis auriculariae]